MLQDFTPKKRIHPSLNHSRRWTEGEDEKYEVLNLVINPTRGLEIVKEAEAYGIKMVLAQPGARSYEIQDFCVKHGMEYVEGCTLVELSY